MLASFSLFFGLCAATAASGKGPFVFNETQRLTGEVEADENGVTVSKDPVSKDPVAKTDQSCGRNAKEEQAFTIALSQIKSETDKDDDKVIDTEFEKFKNENTILSPELITISYQRYIKKLAKIELLKKYQENQEVDTIDLKENVEAYFSVKNYNTIDMYIKNFPLWIQSQAMVLLRNAANDPSLSKVIELAFEKFCLQSDEQGRLLYSTTQVFEAYKAYVRTKAWDLIEDILNKNEAPLTITTRVKTAFSTFYENRSNDHKILATPQIAVEEYRQYVIARAVASLREEYPNEDIEAELNKSMFSPEATKDTNGTFLRLYYIDQTDLVEKFHILRKDPSFRLINADGTVPDNSKNATPGHLKFNDNKDISDLGKPWGHNQGNKPWSGIGIATTVAAFITAVGALVIAVVVLRNYINGRSAFGSAYTSTAASDNEQH